MKRHHELHGEQSKQSCDAQPRGTYSLIVLTDYFLEQGGAAAGQQLIVPVATPWPPHHAMATDAAFGAPHMGANEASPVLVLHTCLLACLIAQVRRCGSSARAWSRARRPSSMPGLLEPDVGAIDLGWREEGLEPLAGVGPKVVIP